MNARDDYPHLAAATAPPEPWSYLDEPRVRCVNEGHAALKEIDRLRSLLLPYEEAIAYLDGTCTGGLHCMATIHIDGCFSCQ